jgi:prepilin peptidase CpaA
LASGKTELLLIAAVILLSSVAMATDLARGRIYNWLTLPGLLSGFAFSAWLGGWAGLGDSVLGATAGLLFYGWMFWLRAMGGGDVKLLMALGAWGGFHYAEEVALLGIVLAGPMAALILLFKGRLLDFGRRMARFVLTLVVRELEPEVPQIDHKLTMPFGIPIGAAAIWSVVAHPLLSWGFKPWP